MVIKSIHIWCTGLTGVVNIKTAYESYSTTETIPEEKYRDTLQKWQDSVINIGKTFNNVMNLV